MGKYQKSRNYLLAVLGVFSVILWIGLLVANLFINSQVYRQNLIDHFSMLRLLVVCLIYSPTNAALLTCLAGLVGGIAGNITYGPQPERWPELPEGQTAADYARMIISILIRTENPCASLLRSFVVYLLFIAGITIASPGNPFPDQQTPDQYLRLAGTLSVLGFIVGYDPSIFSVLLSKIPLTNNSEDRPRRF